MRRPSAFRVSTAVAVVATIVAVLAVMFPGLGFGLTTTTHGGTPSDVFMSTEPNCVDEPVGTEPRSLLPTTVIVGEELADLLVYFTTTSSGIGLDRELLLTLQVEGGGFFMSSPQWISHGNSPRTPHSTLTVMWSFPDVPFGQYTVQATARGEGANLQSCALSVFVMPLAPPLPIP